MPIENFAEVQEYLNTNNVEGNEVKTYLDSLKVAVQPTLEVFKGLTNTNVDYKSFMDSEKDKHSTKNMETWKTNNLTKLVDDEVNKRFPKADVKDVEFAKYKAEQEKITASTNAVIAKMQADGTRKDNGKRATQIAQEGGLSTSLIKHLDRLVGTTLEETENNVTGFLADLAIHDEALKLEGYKANSYVPPNSKGGVGGDEKVRAEIAKYMK